jgi:hypothetical protein
MSTTDREEAVLSKQEIELIQAALTSATFQTVLHASERSQVVTNIATV